MATSSSSSTLYTKFILVSAKDVVILQGPPSRSNHTAGYVFYLKSNASDDPSMAPVVALTKIEDYSQDIESELLATRKVDRIEVTTNDDGTLAGFVYSEVNILSHEAVRADARNYVRMLGHEPYSVDYLNGLLLLDGSGLRRRKADDDEMCVICQQEIEVNHPMYIYVPNRNHTYHYWKCLAR